MKNWFRIVAVAVVVAVVFAVAALSARAESPVLSGVEPAAPDGADAPLAGPEPIAQQFWQEDYGDCYLLCGEAFELVYFQTYEQCCNQLHRCSDSSYPSSKHWSPYYGWPLLCQT